MGSAPKAGYLPARDADDFPSLFVASCSSLLPNSSAALPRPFDSSATRQLVDVAPRSAVGPRALYGARLAASVHQPGQQLGVGPRAVDYSQLAVARGAADAIGSENRVKRSGSH